MKVIWVILVWFKCVVTIKGFNYKSKGELNINNAFTRKMVLNENEFNYVINGLFHRNNNIERKEVNTNSINSSSEIISNKNESIIEELKNDNIKVNETLYLNNNVSESYNESIKDNDINNTIIMGETNETIYDNFTNITLLVELNEKLNNIISMLKNKTNKDDYNIKFPNSLVSNLLDVINQFYEQNEKDLLINNPSEVYIEKNNSLSNNSNTSDNNNNTILLSDNETELNYFNSKPQIEIIQNQIDFDPFPNYINI